MTQTLQWALSNADKGCFNYSDQSIYNNNKISTDFVTLALLVGVRVTVWPLHLNLRRLFSPSNLKLGFPHAHDIHIAIVSRSASCKTVGAGCPTIISLSTTTTGATAILKSNVQPSAPPCPSRSTHSQGRSRGFSSRRMAMARSSGRSFTSSGGEYRMCELPGVQPTLPCSAFTQGRGLKGKHEPPRCDAIINKGAHPSTAALVACPGPRRAPIPVKEPPASNAGLCEDGEGRANTQRCTAWAHFLGPACMPVEP